jgi:hypothetical protein
MQDDAALAARIEASPQAPRIVNQRAHAQALFGAIRHQPGAQHLSTCMHSAHRTRGFHQSDRSGRRTLGLPPVVEPVHKLFKTGEWQGTSLARFRDRSATR